MRLADSVTISAPIEEAFDGWAALERSSEHQKPTIERTRLTDGDLAKGTRYRAADQWPGRKVTFEMEITDFQRPSRISARQEKPMSGSWTARFHEDGGVTRMEFETTIEPTGLMRMPGSRSGTVRAGRLRREHSDDSVPVSVRTGCAGCPVERLGPPRIEVGAHIRVNTWKLDRIRARRLRYELSSEIPTFVLATPVGA